LLATPARRLANIQSKTRANFGKWLFSGVSGGQPPRRS
jgi:hypothetical protein